MDTQHPIAFDDERIMSRADAATHGLASIAAGIDDQSGLVVLGTLASAIAHEFASLLTPLKANAQLVLRRPDNTDAAQRLANEVLCSTARGVALIDAILAMAPGTAQGLTTPHCASEAAELDPIIQRILGDLSDGPGVVVHIEAGLRVTAPDAAVERILANLVENARRAAREGGTVSISARTVSEADRSERRRGDRRVGRADEQRAETGTDGQCSTGNIDEARTVVAHGPVPMGPVTGSIPDYSAVPNGGAGVVHASSGAWIDGPCVRIEVRDTGEGIDPAVARQLFDPFVSGRNGGRRGLGLAIVAGLVRQHGGTIHCESGRDRGTVFAIELPAAPVASGMPDQSTTGGRVADEGPAGSAQAAA